MPKLNSLEVVHQDTNKDQFETLHDILVGLRNSLAVNREIVDGDARVAIENLLEMYVNDKEAFLRSLQTLTAQFKASEAKYEEEILLQASALEALARRTTTLTAQTENNIASVREYSEAVASEVARKTATYSQDTAPTENLTYGDIWIDTNDNNRMYSWNGLVWVEVSKAPTYRQPNQPSTAAEGDLWMDTDDNNKMWRYDGSTWVATDDLRIAKTYARWGVQVNANGHVAGIQLNADDLGTSEFTVLADAFRVYNTSSGTEDAIFTVQGGKVTPKNIQLVDSSGNYILSANNFSPNVTMWKPLLQMGNASNLGNPGLPSFSADGSSSSNTWVLGGTASGSNSNNHGIRGRNTNYGTSGIVGVAGSYDFYADGTGTNYGPFTGSHDALIDNSIPYEVGDIVIDSALVVKKNVSNTLFEVAPSTTSNQKGVIGVIAVIGQPLNTSFIPTALGVVRNEEDVAVGENVELYTALKDNKLVTSINAVGEGQINVCGENGDIGVGDLIVSSSLAGKGMKQADDIIRSYTVAKAREAVTFSSPTEVKQIACIYLCG